jgi:hypothetical protein
MADGMWFLMQLTVLRNIDLHRTIIEYLCALEEPEKRFGKSALRFANNKVGNLIKNIEFC